ncbi:hypothetical protein [Tsukamurella soli]|uniref:Tetratricopeptide repeat-containing protein n=1 Tax=Tsukamurella soli TaxID=644556 RepID=A0ABP8K211_9ACTN
MTALESTVSQPVVKGTQPLGIFSFPAGLLLIPARTDEEDAVRATLVSGRLPAHWPASLASVRRAYLDDAPADAAPVTATGDGAAAAEESADDPIDLYNRWALSPDAETAGAVRAGLPDPWPALVDLVCYIAGLADEPPADDPARPAELRALTLVAAASARMGDDPPAAYRLLHRAAALATLASPVLAAVLLGDAGGVLVDQGADPEAAYADLESALAGLSDTDLAAVRAELHGRLGSLMHEQLARAGAPLAEAMGHYLDGLALVTRDSAPYVWASLQLDLATAHLASPMTEATDRLRLGVAAQSLRAAREVFTSGDHPGPWSTATLDLANALVYAPSTHPRDNLMEAVDLYEEILRSGVRDDQPTARARVLANQGNALAHLGLLDDARARLVEARSVFEEFLDREAVMAVREVLDAIARSGITDPDQAGFEAELARASAQYDRMPGTDEAGRTSGMGVRVAPTVPPPDAQRRAKVTVLPRSGAGSVASGPA